MRPLAVLVVCSVTLATGAQPPPNQEVKAAQAEYAAALAKAKSDYDVVVKKATTEHRDKLKGIQTDRTKAGDLDGAVAVRNLIAELDEGEASARSKELLARDKFAAAVSKVEWSPGRGGWGQDFVFAADGYVYSPPSKRMTATWAATGPGTVVVVNQSGIVDVFSIDLGKGTAKVSSVGTTQKAAASWEAAKTK